jgi:hypothetical protein
MGVFEHFPYANFHELNAEWLIKKMKELLDRMQSIEDWKDEYQETYDNLKQLYDDLMAGNFPPSFVEALTKWISEYGIEIIAEKIKAVHFGLTNDGYFCAYIPDSWSDIHFETVEDYDDSLYGHLMLLYD